MVPQGNHDLDVATANRLFNAFKDRDFDNSRMQINELKQIFGLTLDWKYHGVGADNNKSWDVEVSIAESRLPELCGLSAVGYGKRKSVAVEQAATALVDVVTQKAEVVLQKLSDEVTTQRSIEFHKRMDEIEDHVRYHEPEHQEAVRILLTQDLKKREAEAKPAEKEEDVERDHVNLEPPSVKPTTNSQRFIATLARRAEVENLKKLCERCNELGDFYTQLTVDGTSLRNMFKINSLSAETLLQYKGDRDCRAQVVLTYNGKFGRHIVSKDLIFERTTTSTQTRILWSAAFGTITLQALKELIQGLEVGWITAADE